MPRSPETPSRVVRLAALCAAALRLLGVAALVGLGCSTRVAATDDAAVIADAPPASEASAPDAVALVDSAAVPDVPAATDVAPVRSDEGVDAALDAAPLPPDGVVTYLARYHSLARLGVLCPMLQTTRGAARTNVPRGGATLLRVHTANEAVAAPAPVEDCAEGGVITVGAGETQVEVDVLIDARTYRVNYSVQVIDERVPVSTDYLGGTLHVDDQQAITLTPTLLPGNRSPGVGLRPSWITLRTPSSAVSLERGVGNRWLARARALGEALVTVAYGPSGMEQSYTATEPLRVVAPGTLLRVESVRYRAVDGAGEFGRFELLPTQCTDVGLWGEYRLASGDRYTARVPVAMTRFGATGVARIESESPPRVCADARGEATIRGCAGSSCVEDVAFVGWREARFTFVAQTPTLTRPDEQFVEGCITPIGAASFSDGSRVAIPYAPERWRFHASERVPPFASIILQEQPGAPERFCFRAQTASAEFSLFAQVGALSSSRTLTVP